MFRSTHNIYCHGEIRKVLEMALNDGNIARAIKPRLDNEINKNKADIFLILP